MATSRSATTTTDHDEIRSWVEQRGGFPSHVKRTAGGDDPGILRIDYPGFTGAESLERIPWDEFFEWFDRNNLAFLYEDEGDSRFSKLVDRGTVQARQSGQQRASKRPASRKTAGTKTAAKKSASRKGDAKKTAAKRGATKKVAARKPSRKAASKKAAAKKRGAKKGGAKTAARRKK
ncbi:MAG: hypothetical protein ACRD2J_06865 [Thermoanaerobaculia bacterium]